MSINKDESYSNPFRDWHLKRWESRMIYAIDRGDYDYVRNALIKEKAAGFISLQADKLNKLPGLLEYALLKRGNEDAGSEERAHIQRILYYMECCYILSDSRKLTNELIERIGPSTNHPLDQAIMYGYDHRPSRPEMQRLFKAFGSLNIQSNCLARGEDHYASSYNNYFYFKQYERWENEGLANLKETSLWEIKTSFARVAQEVADINLTEEQIKAQTHRSIRMNQPTPSINGPLENLEVWQKNAEARKKKSSKGEAPQLTELQLIQLEQAKALYRAARGGKVEQVIALVEKGAPLNLAWSAPSGWGRGKYTYRPLTGAALCQDPKASFEIISYLLKNGADPNFSSKQFSSRRKNYPNDLLYIIESKEKNSWNQSTIKVVREGLLKKPDLQEPKPQATAPLRSTETTINLTKEASIVPFLNQDIITRTEDHLRTGRIEDLDKDHHALIQALAAIVNNEQYQEEATKISLLLAAIRNRLSERLYAENSSSASSSSNASGSAQVSSQVSSSSSSSAGVRFSGEGLSGSELDLDGQRFIDLQIPTLQAGNNDAKIRTTIPPKTDIAPGRLGHFGASIVTQKISSDRDQSIAIVSSLDRKLC